MKIIAVSQIKGGVGKTTTAVNLAYLAAAGGWRTLIWDLDAQGAATYLLRAGPQAHGSARKLLAGKRELAELIVPSPYPGLEVLPADFSYRNFDVHLAERKHPTERLLRMSRALREHYSLLFLDCPPGISLLSENVLRAADAVVVPMVPAPLSVRMLAELTAFLAREGWTDLKVLPFFSMVDRRRRLHHEQIGEARRAFPGILRTEIPDWSDIERMSQERAPLPARAPGSIAAALYRQLWHEIERRVGPLEKPSAPAAALKRGADGQGAPAEERPGADHASGALAASAPLERLPPLE